ncbi:MAG: hypothetical protein BWK78_08325 [Thiotrichaceae bacterium IS1]|nr:MAG: hypothetical protein BWK78_08325 [Thiotrichaceae bacterium IS1]
MNTIQNIAGYLYDDSELKHAHNILLPGLLNILDSLKLGDEKKRIFELGCGNGAVANELTKKGFEVIGVDPSEQGIAQANQHFPHLLLKRGSAYDDLTSQYGQFPIVVSLEVVEHVYFPRQFATTLYNLVAPGGTAIISTPYHSYWKNLALAVSGKMDNHFTALWDYGHIKFWSIKTLKTLLEEAGFREIRFRRVGRIPILAKSMIAIAKKDNV